jgi:hypothetical protein
LLFCPGKPGGNSNRVSKQKSYIFDYGLPILLLNY